ncbi:MAG: aminotransferase class III-fold pyridoxal phosphate-dependent enzyme, partial [Lachnoclostridium sp.]|nr:aminotransferase class III-fold pyridoxal phosphate-dependent enzyme [Lachnoclostridium sp.]
MKELMEKAEQYLLHTYNRFPVVLEHGEGVYLYDTNGKKYLDFAAGIGTNALGYGDEEFISAMKEQMDHLLHVSNYFYTKPNLSAVKALAEVTGMDKVFLSNSGTEAVEGAIKLARKYARKKGFTDKTEIISMQHSFHGRSMGAVSVTGTESYRTPFEPLIGTVHFAEFNNLDHVAALVSDKTCAIIVEAIQGEGGIHMANPEFLQGIRKLCDDKDIVMICDEVQCGTGRTGYYFAYEKYGIKPDVVTMAKGIGN